MLVVASLASCFLHLNNLNHHNHLQVLVVASACSLTVKIFLLGLLIRRLGDQWVLALGLTATVTQVCSSSSGGGGGGGGAPSHLWEGARNLHVSTQ